MDETVASSLVSTEDLVNLIVCGASGQFNGNPNFLSKPCGFVYPIGDLVFCPREVECLYKS